MPRTTGAAYGGPFQALKNPTATSDPVLRRTLSNMSENVAEENKHKGFHAGIFANPQSIPTSLITDTVTTANWTKITGWNVQFHEYPAPVDAGYATEGVWQPAAGTWTVPQHLGGYWLMFGLVAWEANSVGWRAARFKHGVKGSIGQVVQNAVTAPMETLQQFYGGWAAPPGTTFEIDVAQYSGGGALNVLGSTFNTSSPSCSIEASRLGDTDERAQL